MLISNSVRISYLRYSQGEAKSFKGNKKINLSDQEAVRAQIRQFANILELNSEKYSLSFIQEGAGENMAIAMFSTEDRHLWKKVETLGFKSPVNANSEPFKPYHSFRPLLINKLTNKPY